MLSGESQYETFGSDRQLPCGRDIAYLADPGVMSSCSYLEKLFRSHILKSPACAVLHAARQEAVVKAVDAKRALPDDLFFWVNLYCSQGAGMSTEAAPCAACFIDQDNSVVSFRQGIAVADMRTNRVLTLNAGGEYKVRVEFPSYPSRLHGDHLIPARPGGQVVLLLAGNLACVTAYASVDIYQ
jgi:hypothetical protein